MPPKSSGPEVITPQGRPSASVASTATTSKTSVAEPVVITVAYRPAGRRSRWLVIVEECPACGGAHAHYGSPYGPPSGRRVAGCGKKTYRMWPVYGGQSSAEDEAVNG
jgi:hypothetical protein